MHNDIWLLLVMADCGWRKMAGDGCLLLMMAVTVMAAGGCSWLMIVGYDLWLLLKDVV